MQVLLTSQSLLSVELHFMIVFTQAKGRKDSALTLHRLCLYIIYVMIDRRRHSSILDVRSFRGADCDTDHYLVLAKLRERLAVRKQATQKFEG